MSPPGSAARRRPDDGELRIHTGARRRGNDPDHAKPLDVTACRCRDFGFMQLFLIRLSVREFVNAPWLAALSINKNREVRFHTSRFRSGDDR